MSIKGEGRKRECRQNKMNTEKECQSMQAVKSKCEGERNREAMCVYVTNWMREGVNGRGGETGSGCSYF